MEIIITDAKEIIKKLFLMIINGILAYYIALHFTNQSFAELTLGLTFVISFLIGEILSPLLALLLILLQNLYIIKQIFLSGSSVSIVTIESLLIPLLFLFILPVIQLASRGNPRGSISAGSILLQSYNPISSLILYYAGVSLSENYTNGILSALPFLNLIFIYHFAEDVIIAVVLIIIGSILYSYNKGFYSIIGVVPIAISSYFLSTYLMSQYIYYGVILSIAVNIIDRVVGIIKSTLENRQAYESEKSKLIEEIKQISTILYSFKNEIGVSNKELTNLINVSINSITTMLNKINECKNLECLKGLEVEINNQKRILTIEVNNLIFDEIREFNEFSERVKTIGIALGEIEYPKEEIKLEDLLDYYKRLKETINSKLVLTVNLMNSFIDNLYKILGILLEKFNVIKMDVILNRLNGLDIQEIDKRINSCISKALETLQIFREQQEFELLKRLSDLTLQKLTLNKVNSARTILEKTNNLLLVELSALRDSIDTIRKVYETTEIENISNILDISMEILQTVDMPYCERVSKLYNYLSELREAIEIAENKESLLHLSELVDTILQEILEEGKIKLSDIGISERYANFIVALLQKKGFKAVVNGDMILVRTNSKRSS